MTKFFIRESSLLSRFLRYVKIASVTFQEKKFALLLAKELKEIGLKIVFDNFGNLIGYLEGIDKNKKPIFFNAHLDTVEPGKNIKPRINNGAIFSDGSTILGADCKAGIAAIVEMLKRIKSQKINYPSIEVVLTRAEEKGLRGAKSLDAKLMHSKFGFVVDGHGEIGKVIVQAPFHVLLKAQILGKAAHAGVCPREGINAIYVASKAIAQMKLGRIDDETTANIGIFNGGKATNIIPEEVLLEGEVRSHQKIKLNKQIALLRNILSKTCQKFKAKLKFETDLAYHSYKFPANHYLVKVCRNAAKKLNFPFQLALSNGGSDANIFNQKRISCIVLASGVQKPHSREEFIRIVDLNKLSDYLVEIVKCQ